MAVKPTGAALVSTVMSKLEDVAVMKWCSLSEYGAAIKSLVVNNDKAQAATLHAIQVQYPTIPYPTIPYNILQIYYKYPIMYYKYPMLPYPTTASKYPTLSLSFLAQSLSHRHPN